MAISSLDNYIASSKQVRIFNKITSRAVVAGNACSLFDIAGTPGAGALAAANVANGVVPVAADVGYPTIDAFAAGAKGYVTRYTYASTVASRLRIFDRLWVGGAYPFNAAQTLTAQPSFASRIPNGDFKSLRLFVETVVAFVGTPLITVTYTNQDGIAGRTTGAVNVGGALALGRMEPLPLQAGDTGLQKVESVTCTGATAGSFNVNVVRPLVEGRVKSVNDGGVLDMLSTGLPEVFATSALFLAVSPDSTQTGIPYAEVEIGSL